MCRLQLGCSNPLLLEFSWQWSCLARFRSRIKQNITLVLWVLRIERGVIPWGGFVVHWVRVWVAHRVLLPCKPWHLLSSYMFTFFILVTPQYRWFRYQDWSRCISLYISISIWGYGDTYQSTKIFAKIGPDVYRYQIEIHINLDIGTCQSRYWSRYIMEIHINLDMEHINILISGLM